MESIKKDGVKNMYCGSCKKWMTEFYVSRHLRSRSHFLAKYFQKKRLPKKRSNSRSNTKATSVKAGKEYTRVKVESGRCQTSTYVGNIDECDNETKFNLPEEGLQQNPRSESQQCKTPDNKEELDLEVDTLKKCKHNHRDIFQEGCSDLESSRSSERLDALKRQLYWSEDNSDNKDVEEVPQNIQVLLGEWDWDWQSALLKDSQTTESDQVPELNIEQQPTSEDNRNFPIEVLSGVFPEKECSNPHCNQLSYYKCHACNPKYK